jgi:hypothetical protein
MRDLGDGSDNLPEGWEERPKNYVVTKKSMENCLKEAEERERIKRESYERWRDGFIDEI